MPRLRGPALAGLVAASALLLAGCLPLPFPGLPDESSPPEEVAAELEQYYEQTIDWTDCGGGFQCGITNVMGTGPEIYDWHGATTGYEGHCVRDCSFVMGVLLRDPAVRAKVYRPVR